MGISRAFACAMNWRNRNSHGTGFRLAVRVAVAVLCAAAMTGLGVASANTITNTATDRYKIRNIGDVGARPDSHRLQGRADASLPPPPWTETETSLEVLPHVQKAGREVALIAHVRGCDGGPAIGGIVTFTVNGKLFKNVTLEGTRTAKLVTRDLPAGLLTIRAEFGFNNLCSGSVSHPVHVLITTRN